MRAGGSGSRGTRRFQPTVPGLGRPRRSAKGHEADRAGVGLIAVTGRAKKISSAERAGQSMRQQGHSRPRRAGARFIVAGHRASAGTGPGALLIVQALPLVQEAMDPGSLRPRADQLLVDRWRSRSDCGGVHQASETPIARAVTNIPAFAAIP